jgi:type I restriction enzyme S subunit
LYYFLDTYLEKLREQSIGGVIKYIKLENLTEAKIPLPPLATQQRIAAILDAADALRRKDQELLRKYDELAQAIFIDMFGDPVKNEKGWEVKKFLEFSIFENGDRSSNYPTQKDLVVNGIPFFGTNDITNGQLSDFGLRFISTEKFNSLGRGKLKYNDLVITLRGSIGNCAIFNSSFFETGFINAQMMIIRTESQIIEPVFLQFLYLSDSFQRSLISITGGSAVPQITSAQVKDFIAIAPPISMQRDFIEQLEKIKNLIKNCSKELSSQLFNSLLQQAFNGELVA